jgi:hypothetical protein
LQHETTFTADLLELEQYTTPIQVDPGGQLYDNDNDRGLFFIENGVMVSNGDHFEVKLVLSV